MPSLSQLNRVKQPTKQLSNLSEGDAIVLYKNGVAEMFVRITTVSGEFAFAGDIKFDKAVKGGICKVHNRESKYGHNTFSPVWQLSKKPCYTWQVATDEQLLFWRSQQTAIGVQIVRYSADNREMIAKAQKEKRVTRLREILSCLPDNVKSEAGELLQGV